MGAIPIVQNSLLMPIFNETTSLVLENLNEINLYMLNNPYLFIKNMSFSKGVLFFSNWLEKIDFFKLKYINIELI